MTYWDTREMSPNNFDERIQLTRKLNLRGNFSPRQTNNRLTRKARRSAILFRFASVNPTLIASFGSDTILFSWSIHCVLFTLGIRAPTRLISLSTLSTFSAFRSLKVSNKRPSPSSVFPSVKSTTIWNLNWGDQRNFQRNFYMNW